MSWNPLMLREVYKNGPWMSVVRDKTKKKIKIVFDENEPMEIISPILFDDGEILTDIGGTKIRTLGIVGLGMDSWSYKAYAIEIVD